MTAAKEKAPPYSDLVTETLSASNHPHAQWLSDTYVSILDYVTSPRPFNEGRRAYEQADRDLVDQDIILRSILNNAGVEVSDYFDDAMNQAHNCEWEKYLKDRNQGLPNAS